MLTGWITTATVRPTKGVEGGRFASLGDDQTLRIELFEQGIAP